MHIHVSHQSNQLIEKLKRLLYASSDKFTSKLLVVPCDHVKKKIEMAFCDDPNFGVFMGVRSLNLNLMMAHLLKIFPRPHRFASQSDLAFMLEALHDEKKEAAFFDALAGVFLKYGLYFGPKWREWKKGSEWQPTLIRALSQYFTFPLDIFQSIEPIDPKAKKVEIHIFGLSEIPTLYFEYLLQAAPHLDIHLYQLTFSNRYWGDLLSSRQRLSLAKKLAKEEAKSEELQEYLDHHNPLFANLCRYGQPLLLQLLDSNLPLDEEEEEPIFPLTLLGALQHNLFHLEEGRQSNVAQDHTLQIFEAPNPIAEVQNLYDALCHKIDTLDISPNEISVLAPDINLYAPYIELIFGKEESKLGYQIEGVKGMMQSESLKLIHHILDLFDSRWEKSEVLEVIESPVAQKKMGIDLSEVAILKQWLDTTQMLWGIDKAHRSEFIKEQTKESGTLKESFKKLLASLASDESSGFTSELTLAPLMEKWITYFTQIIDGIEEIRSGDKTLKEWYWTLWNLFDKLLDDAEPFIDGMRALFNVEALTQEARYSYASIEPHLRHILSAKKANVNRFDRPPIRFASIQPGEAYFSQCVALIGMNQGDFPRYTPPHSFDLLQKEAIPRQNHIDRFFFLEVLSCTRRALILSYQEEPSVCITDLQNHLRRTFGVESIVETVLDLPFIDPQLKKSYSHSTYALAEQFNTPERPFFSHFSNKKPIEKKEQFSVSELKTIARNPYQYVANHTFHFYHPSALQGQEWLKEFILTHHDKALLRAAALHTPYKELVEQLSYKMALSNALFEQVAHIDLKEEYETIQKSIEHFNLSFFSLTLTPFAQKLAKVDGNQYEHPPISINGVEIVGRIDHLCAQGLAIVGRNRFEDLFKVWPLLLIINEIEGLFEEEIVLFTLRDQKKRVVVIEAGLSSFIDYATEVAHLRAPLHPALAEALLVKKESDYQKEVKTLFSDRSFLSSEPYFQWAFHSHKEVLDHVDFTTYQKAMSTTFSPFVKWVKQ